MLNINSLLFKALLLLSSILSSSFSHENVFDNHIRAALERIESNEINEGLRQFRIGYNATIPLWVQPDHALIDKCLERARLDPSDTKSAAYFAIGLLIVHRTGNQQLPPLLFDEGIKKNPILPELYNHMAAIYCNSELYEKALQMATSAIDLNPNYADAISNRSYIYRKLKQNDKSLEDLIRYQTIVQP